MGLNHKPDIKVPIYFNIAEYCLFAIILSVFLVIIFYYNVRKKSSTVSDFLFGGKNMSIASVTVALISSHVTSITLLGIPLEVYMRGTQYWASALALIVVSILAAFIYLPVFHKLQLSSSFEYLEIRFSTHTRNVAAVLFVLSKLMILPILPYVPMLAFREVTKPLANRVTAVVCVFCATFCAIGGLRAIIAVGIATTIVAVAANALTSWLAIIPFGFQKMWDTADKGGRIIFYDPQFAQHTSFLAITLAVSTNWLWKMGLSQSSLQKLLSVPSINKARLCLAFSCLGIIFMKWLSCFLGLVIFAWFSGCDPLLSGQIRKNEQLVPLFLSTLASLFPGICGVFLTAVFCASTCCIASTVNSVSGVIFEEFIRAWLPQNISEQACCRLMKGLCIICGVYCGLMAWLMPNLDKLQHSAIGVTGVAAGTLLGLFTLGIVFSRANCAGALSGTMVSLLLCGWLLLGAENAWASSRVFLNGKTMPSLPCTNRSNFTGFAFHNLTGKVSSPTINNPSGTRLQSLFRITYTYCPFAGAITVLVIGLAMSCLTGKSRTESLNPDMFCPMTQSFLPRTPSRSRARSLEDKLPDTGEMYEAIDEALKQLKEAIDK